MFTLVHEQDDFLLINKDAGVSFHQDGDFPGLPGLVREKTGVAALFPVHRLDKMTSGLLVFAKNKKTAHDLSGQFSTGNVEKYYLALSDKVPKKKQGLIQGDMLRARRGAWRLSRTRSNPAITRFVSFPLVEGLRLFILRPYTGKTHQLRVALKSIGAPALGDSLYHPENSQGVLQPDRGYLHSFFLAFHLAGTYYDFACTPAQGVYFSEGAFLQVLAKLQEPWTFFPEKTTGRKAGS